MATFVLVHGAWTGGWQWRPVASLLRAAGHDVYTPTLTGLGERVHLSSPDVGLDTHVQDVLGVLRYEDLHGVVLVGYDYGGAVVTGVAERASEWLSQLIYLDAFVPQDGQAVVDLWDVDFTAIMLDLARAQGDGWRVPPMPPENSAPDFIRALLGRRVPHPLRTWQQPLAVTNPAAAALPRSYIFCTEKPRMRLFGATTAAAERARREGWRYHELGTGHRPMWTAPQEVAALLAGLAA